MKRIIISLLALGSISSYPSILLLLLASTAFAQTQSPAQVQTQTQTRWQVQTQTQTRGQIQTQHLLSFEGYLAGEGGTYSRCYVTFKDGYFGLVGESQEVIGMLRGPHGEQPEFRTYKNSLESKKTTAEKFETTKAEFFKKAALLASKGICETAVLKNLK